jgi:hypothetical protein
MVQTMVGLNTSGMSTITPLRVTLPVLVAATVRLTIVPASHKHAHSAHLKA